MSLVCLKGNFGLHSSTHCFTPFDQAKIMTLSQLNTQLVYVGSGKATSISGCHHGVPSSQVQISTETLVF